jgi:ATP-binding cassette, subfamily C (CFTR/MRP), member 1
MIFSCFHPFTGGRVKEIITQEGRRGNKKFAKEEDKFEKFCETWKGFIDVTDAYERFFGNWENQKALAGPNLTLEAQRKIPMLRRSLVKSFTSDLFKAFCGKMAWSLLVIFSIWFFVFEILGFIRNKADGLYTGIEGYEYILCAGFFVNLFLLSVGIQQMGVYSSILGCKVKAALTTAIFKKMIIRDPYESKADVVSLVSKDVEKLAEACLSLQYLWSGIFETLAVLAVLVYMLGTSIVPGIVVMAIFLPLQYFLGMIVAVRKKKLSYVSSKRTSLMEEIMRSIKLIKIYGWEASFFQNLNDIRDEEKEKLASINFVQAAIYGLIFALPPMVSLAVFGTEEILGEIESVMVFTTLSFFNTLRVPFSKLPKSLRDVLDSFACLERIQDFLLEPDLHAELAKGSDSSDLSTFDAESAGKHKDSKSTGIVYHKANFSYGIGGKIVLKDINLNVPQGSLMMVAGTVASGKSNLLKSILGDLTVRGGTTTETHNRAYVPQTPWTALGTVRDNIVFGLPYVEKFYNQVIFACALEADMKIMPQGDQTWIGERGGNLSGGQKQRIALARAAYSRADLYVLDSPLSAVDMYTCQHIFKHCIKEMMIGGGGTVVLATHQTELFSFSDHLVVMANGVQVYNNKYSFSGVRHLFPNMAEEAEQTPESQAESTKPSAGKERLETNQRSARSKKLRPMLSMASNRDEKSQQELLEDEQENIYVWYIKRLGVCAFAIAILIFIIGQIVRVYSDNWIAVWSRKQYADAVENDEAFYIGMYGVTVVVFVCLSFARSFYWYYIGREGAGRIHDLAFAAALKAPMHFFHLTPIGNLLSFFSKDVNTIDDVLVDNMLLFWIMFWILILALSVVTYNLPLFLAIVFPLAVAYVYIVKVFIRTSAPLMRSSGVSVKQVVAHTAETLSGLAVVRAFRQQEKFLEDNRKFQSRSVVTSFSITNLQLWLAFRVDIIGAMLVLACCLLAVISDTMKPSVAGLIVSNSFQILLFFSIMSRFMGEIHDNMTGVANARNMADLEAERQPILKTEAPEEWPSKGEIKFDHVVMPYLPGKPPVLKGVTFTVKEGEKIGVVGRTGAGKSSLIVALYRLAEISQGTIQVDDVDCSTVDLTTLRSSMAIIPQEPVMFGGTVRTNLDPFDQYDDDELVDVLQKCLLGPMLEANPDGLNTKVDQMGSNFSLGTQQLMCLARAMLNPSRILLLDEATASLDSDTNAAVSQVLKTYFSDRTIFTIAHRLDTIIESDRILTVSAGVVAEFDRPDVLLANPESIFHELCMNTGKAQFDALAAKANEHARDKGLEVVGPAKSTYLEDLEDEVDC